MESEGDSVTPKRHSESYFMEAALLVSSHSKLLASTFTCFMVSMTQCEHQLLDPSGLKAHCSQRDFTPFYIYFHTMRLE